MLPHTPPALETPRLRLQPLDRPGELGWALLRREDGRRIGHCRLRRPDPVAGTLELDGRLRPGERGQGLMQEAVTAIAAEAAGWGFATLLAEAPGTDARTRRWLLRLGFVPGGGACWVRAAGFMPRAGVAAAPGDLPVRFDDAPAPAALQRIDDGIGEANDGAAPLHEVRPLACVAHDAGAAVVGGAVGRTWGRCAELQQLWVDPAWRGRGLGATLVRRFEAAAAARGCGTVYLETFSFQAPRLYRALGYEALSAIAGFAPGVVKYQMARRLAAPPAGHS